MKFENFESWFENVDMLEDQPIAEYVDHRVGEFKFLSHPENYNTVKFLMKLAYEAGKTVG